MYCNHCGKEIADDSTFCMHCGTSIFNYKSSLDNNNTGTKKKEYLKVTLIVIITIIVALYSYSYCAREAEVAKMTARMIRNINSKELELNSFLYEHDVKNRGEYERNFADFSQDKFKAKEYDDEKNKYVILSIILPIVVISVGCLCIFFVRKH